MSAFLWGGARGANSGKRRCAGRETGVGEKMCTQKVKMAHTHARVHTNTVHATKRCVRASGEPRERHQSSQAKHEVCRDEEHVLGEND